MRLDAFNDGIVLFKVFYPHSTDDDIISMNHCVEKKLLDFNLQKRAGLIIGRYPVNICWHSRSYSTTESTYVPSDNHVSESTEGYYGDSVFKRLKLPFHLLPTYKSSMSPISTVDQKTAPLQNYTDKYPYEGVQSLQLPIVLKPIGRKKNCLNTIKELSVLSKFESVLATDISPSFLFINH